MILITDRVVLAGLYLPGGWGLTPYEKWLTSCIVYKNSKGGQF